MPFQRGTLECAIALARLTHLVSMMYWASASLTPRRIRPGFAPPRGGAARWSQATVPGGLPPKLAHRARQVLGAGLAADTLTLGEPRGSLRVTAQVACAGAWSPTVRVW